MGSSQKRWAMVMAAAALFSTADAYGSGPKAPIEAGRTQTVVFTRPFVVPVGDDLRTTGMVVVSLNIEMNKKDALIAQEKEEILRDRILAALMGLSHDGRFDDGITDPEIAELIKETVRHAVEQVFPGVTEEVLIQDLLSRRVL